VSSCNATQDKIGDFVPDSSIITSLDVSKVNWIYIQVVFYITMPSEKSLASFAPIFILAGMIILIPTITEKAMGSIDARVGSPTGFASFSKVQTHLDAGKFVNGPTPTGTFVKWTTAGTGVFGGDEKGYVRYDVGGWGTATFYFENPSSGQNTCKVVASTALQAAKCKITQGNHATAQYLLCNPGTFDCEIKHNHP
jgi:hypothetical protein